MRTDTLMEFCQDAQFKLEAIPSGTVEYVESLAFLDAIQEEVKRTTLLLNVAISELPSSAKNGQKYCRSLVKYLGRNFCTYFSQKLISLPKECFWGDLQSHCLQEDCSRGH